MSMDQLHILSKLNKYLELKMDEKHDQAILQDLFNKFKKGHCLGFSICHAAMHYLGKSAWWEGVLRAVCLWNEKKESLRDKIYFSYFSNGYTLEELFERAINYIFFHHSFREKSLTDGFLIENMHPQRILKNSFEILDHNNSIIRPEYNAFPGFFSSENLGALLDFNLIQNRICILSSQEHAIALETHTSIFDSCKKSWILYDPNYDHIIQIKKYFYNKEELVREIFSILGSTIVLEVASFDQPIKLQLIKLPFLTDLLQQTGLHFFARYNPEVLIELFKSNGTVTNKKLFDDGIKKSLTMRCWDEIQNNGLFTLFQYLNDEQLATAVNYIFSIEDFGNDFTNALFTRNTLGVTAFNLACLKRMDLNYLLNPIKELKIFSFLFEFALCVKTQAKSILFHDICLYTPHALPTILEIIKLNPNLTSALSSALISKNSQDKTGYEILVMKLPKLVLPVITLILERHYYAVAINLRIQNADGDNLFTLIKKFTPWLQKNIALRFFSELKSNKRLTSWDLQQLLANLDKIYPEDTFTYNKKLRAYNRNKFFSPYHKPTLWEKLFADIKDKIRKQNPHSVMRNQATAAM